MRCALSWMRKFYHRGMDDQCANEIRATFESNAKPLGQRVRNEIHLFFGQRAESSLQLHRENRLHLLKVKGAGLQERFWNVQFPAIATKRSCVEKNCDD